MGIFVAIAVIVNDTISHYQRKREFEAFIQRITERKAREAAERAKII